MGSAIIDAIRAGGGYLQDHGIWVALGVSLLVLLVAFRKKADEAGMAKTPEDVQRKAQRRQDSIESIGCLIGGLAAIIVTVWMIYGMFFA